MRLEGGQKIEHIVKVGAKFFQVDQVCSGPGSNFDAGQALSPVSLRCKQWEFPYQKIEI